jgi:hypothetical protein
VFCFNLSHEPPGFSTVLNNTSPRYTLWVYRRDDLNLKSTAHFEMKGCKNKGVPPSAVHFERQQLRVETVSDYVSRIGRLAGMLYMENGRFSLESLRGGGDEVR